VYLDIDCSRVATCSLQLATTGNRKPTTDNRQSTDIATEKEAGNQRGCNYDERSQMPDAKDDDDDDNDDDDNEDDDNDDDDNDEEDFAIRSQTQWAKNAIAKQQQQLIL